MKTILATKEKMTQIFDEEGVSYPATIVNAGPVTIIQVKTTAKDKYNAILVGYGNRSLKNISKPQQGQFKDMGNFLYTREFKISEADLEKVKVGDKIDVSAFAEGDMVNLIGYSKGKGFQGVVKRHKFKGGPRTHGQKHSEREPGSIGGGGRAGGRVIKGMRMAGRMGNDKITLKKIQVLLVDTEKNQLVLKGSIPGRRGTLIKINA